MKRTASVKKISKSKGSSTPRLKRSNATAARSKRFVFCIQNGDGTDLEVRKVYRLRTDRDAEADGLLRIIDDSGDDYLYPAKYFVHLKLPAKASGVFQIPR